MRIPGAMNINTNISLGGTIPVAPNVGGSNAAEAAEWVRKPEGLSVTESKFGEVSSVTDEIERDLDRNDNLGKLFQKAFSMMPPPLPAAIAEG